MTTTGFTTTGFTTTFKRYAYKSGIGIVFDFQPLNDAADL